jgi:hypothetical protein
MTPNTDSTPNLPSRLRWVRADDDVLDGPREEIMRQYAESGFDGRLVPLDVAQVPTAQPRPVTLRPGVDVDPEAEARILAAEKFLKARGFAPPPTWFAAGTEMLPEGRAKFGSLAKRHADLPVFRDAAREVIDVIRAEDRRDMVLGDARVLRLTPDGQLTRGNAPIALEPNALKGLIGKFPKAFPNAWAFLSLLDPAARAEAVNAQLARLGDWYRDDERNLRLRLRNVGGWRAFAAVSPTYMPMDADRVLAAYADTLDGLGLPDPRGAIAYNGETTDVTIRATWHAPQSFRPSVGDVFESGISARTNDAGNGSHRAGNTFTRIICINCTTGDFGNDTLRRVHKGSRVSDLTAQGLAKIQQDVADVVSRTGDAARFFLDAWGILRETPVTRVRKDGDPKAFLKSLVASGELDADVARDTMVEALLRGFDVEPGETLADVFNAVTRAAHDGLLDEAQRWRVERAAGSLLPVLAERASA